MDTGRARTILVNPPQGGNSDIPNVALGYLAATTYLRDSRVVDLNTFPTDLDRSPMSIPRCAVRKMRRLS